MTVLVGKENTGTTRLKKLETDPFEMSQILFKHLVLSNETEAYQGGAENLKALVGSDILKANEKHQNDPRHEYFKGHIVLIGKNPLSITDTGGALLRRVRLIKERPSMSARRGRIYYTGQEVNGKEI
uniref:NrS-1 polymerase-like helicase domain-containing protein n=1 Tax=Anthoceros angustus TaxID=48387 RepID=A0A2P1L4W3_ANTAG|nr:hypothetical protein AnanMp21 [Anthoceros angustus]AVP12846.1 hypothetical protein AnanMp21 [Anthoceros angustus]